MDKIKANLPSQDSATGRGLKTALQTFIGVLLVFITGLVTTINNVPGCSSAVMDYVGKNIAQIAGLFGLSSGVVSFVWNLLRDDVKNY